MQTIDPATLAAEGHADWALVDVRTPAEFAALHATGAINLPLDQLETAALREQVPTGRVLLLCQSGQRARRAAEQLGQVADYELQVLDGGTAAWERAGLPVVKGKGVISIERQVRIGAGFLVALGVGLGYWVHPGFLGLSAFVGCGLMFAGITDFCGMGLMLAKMPWNRRVS